MIALEGRTNHTELNKSHVANPDHILKVTGCRAHCTAEKGANVDGEYANG